MQAQIEAILTTLVAFPSVSNDARACHAIIDYVRGELEPLGLYVTSSTDQPNPWFVATTKDTKTPDILLAAHLDVVPAPLPSFAMQNVDGKLYGRGTYDMKFAAACYIAFAKAHASTLHTLNIGFLFTTDEEIGGEQSIPQFLAAGYRPGRVLLPDGGEPWHIEARAKGFYGIRLTATGITAHGSRPWEGDNALHTLLDITQALRAQYPERATTDATLAVTSIHGGTTFNQITDHATATYDFRSFDAVELADFKRQLETLCSPRNVTIEITQQGAPVAFDKTSPAVQDFLAELQAATGNDVAYQDSFGGSDARYFAAAHVPTIIIEPMGGGRHAPNEWILASDLHRYYRLLERWLLPAKSYHSILHTQENKEERG